MNELPMSLEVTVTRQHLNAAKRRSGLSCSRRTCWGVVTVAEFSDQYKVIHVDPAGDLDVEQSPAANVPKGL
jgi:hypothetical protein